MAFADKVESQSTIILPQFKLESDIILKNVPVCFKTWGKLDESKTNIMVICHALTGSSDVADWWGPLLGPGLAFDTDRYFIFCGNVLGSPYGTCSPVTINPETNELYGPKFPTTTIRDDVNLFKMVLDTLGVESIRFVIGGSMGGMLALEWSFLGINYVKNVVCIATSARHSAWCIGWSEAQRQSIYSDPKYHDGFYDLKDPPINGLSSARMTALLTYRSHKSFKTRFDRKLNTKGNDSNQSDKNQDIYSAQAYLRYQGTKFVNRFDANCYISLTKKMDTHDVSRDRNTLDEALSSLKQPMLVVGIETDGLFTVSEQEEIAQLVPNSILKIIYSPEGHDGFLLEFEEMNRLIREFVLDQDHINNKSVINAKVNVIKDSTFGEAEDMLLW